MTREDLPESEREEIEALAEKLCDNWEDMDVVDRGEAIVDLRDRGMSQREMARMLDYDESLIRYLAIVGELPYPSKVRIWAGESPRKFVTEVRAQWRAALQEALSEGDPEDVKQLTRELRENWQHWDDVDRGEAILELRERGATLRRLGRLVGCSEGLIRHLSIVGELPYQFKLRIRAGESTRKFMAWARERRRQAEE